MILIDRDEKQTMEIFVLQHLYKVTQLVVKKCNFSFILPPNILKTTHLRKNLSLWSIVSDKFNFTVNAKDEL